MKKMDGLWIGEGQSRIWDFPGDNKKRNFTRRERLNFKQVFSENSKNTEIFNRKSGLTCTVISDKEKNKASVKRLSASAGKISAKDLFICSYAAVKNSNEEVLKDFLHPRANLFVPARQSQRAIRCSIIEDHLKPVSSIEENQDIQKLSNWFDETLKTTVLFSPVPPQKTSSKNDLKKANFFLKNSVLKLLQLEKKTDKSKSFLISKIFTSYRRYWELLLLAESSALTEEIKSLKNDLKNQKTFSELSKKFSQKIQLVIFIQLKKGTPEKNMSGSAEKKNEEKLKPKDTSFHHRPVGRTIKNLNLMVDRETQTSCVSDNKTLESCQEVEDEIKSLKDSGLIPENAEVASWSAGYFTGISRGRTLAQQEALQTEENLNTDHGLCASKLTENNHLLDLNKNILFKDESDYSCKTEEDQLKYPRRKRKIASTTKFKEFNFNREKKIKKNIKKKSIREKVLKISREDLFKRKKMSKKMLIKLINSCYFSLVGSDPPEDLLEYLHTEFEKKSSLQMFGDKKILDFLSNLFQNFSVCKIRLFVRFLDLSEVINEPKFHSAKECLSAYLAGLQSVLNSKLGIMPEFNDLSEVNFVPQVRVLEFYKSFFKDFPSHFFSKLLEFAEKNTIFDRTRLNKSGVVDLEQCLIFCITLYDEYLNKNPRV